jgi:predicted nuclease with TOPRIM domain
MKGTISRLEQEKSQLDINVSNLHTKVEILGAENTDLKMRLAMMKHLQPVDFEDVTGKLNTKNIELIASQARAQDQRKNIIKGLIFFFFLRLLLTNILDFHWLESVMKHFKEVHFGMEENEENYDFPTFPAFLSSREEDLVLQGSDQESESNETSNLSESSEGY